MNHTLKTLPKSQVELTITVTPAEYQKNLKKAATKISLVTAIKGFRPGKAPFEMIKKEIDDMKILQEALESIIQETFFTVIKAEKLNTVGMPKIEVEKIAPDNDVVYKAVVAILPEMKLPELSKIKVSRTVKPVDEKQIEETLKALRGMHATEVLKTSAAQGDDKMVIDMDMLIDNVPIEGGQAKNYQVYLGEDHYIPGFNEQVVGLKEGEEKEFQLNFPKEHYQKQLAGKNITFKIKVKGVYERQLPELNDELAKKAGQDSLQKLTDLIRHNLVEENEHKANEQAEIAILEKLIAETKFVDDLPEVLIDSERQKMFHELKHDLTKNGISIEKYLEDIKKTEKDLYTDFKAQAEKRAKSTLILRQIALEQEIKATEEEIAHEIELIRAAYKDDEEAIKNLARVEIKETLANTLQNKKVIQWLKDQILGEDQHKHEEVKK